MKCFVELLRLSLIVSFSLAHLAPTYAASLVIGKNAKAGVDAPVCRLLSYSNDKKLINICSGTLLESGDEIATAAHCMAWMKEEKGFVQAECGFQAIDSKVSPVIEITRHGTKIPVTGFKFSEKRTSRQVDIHADYKHSDTPSTFTAVDRAVIHLRNPITSMTGISLPKSMTEMELSNCKIAGFGTAADGKTGYPHEATFDFTNVQVDVKGDAFAFESHQLISQVEYDTGRAKTQYALDHPNDEAAETKALRFAVDLGGFAAMQLGGDSDGPLLCRVDGKPWRLIGIISAYSHHYADFSFWDAWKVQIFNYFALTEPSTFYTGLMRAKP